MLQKVGHMDANSSKIKSFLASTPPFLDSKAHERFALFFQYKARTIGTSQTPVIIVLGMRYELWANEQAMQLWANEQAMQVFTAGKQASCMRPCMLSLEPKQHLHAAMQTSTALTQILISVILLGTPKNQGRREYTLRRHVRAK